MQMFGVATTAGVSLEMPAVSFARLLRRPVKLHQGTTLDNLASIAGQPQHPP
jgi:hypothetical protein